MAVESISMSIKNSSQFKGNKLSSPAKKMDSKEHIFLVALG